MMHRDHVPERGHTVAGGPAHNEAPIRVRASLTHLLHAVSCPHLTHSHLGLYFEVSWRPEHNKNKNAVALGIYAADHSPHQTDEVVYEKNYNLWGGEF